MKVLGFVGKPHKELTNKLIKKLIKENFIPVVSPMGLRMKKNKHITLTLIQLLERLLKVLKSRRLLLMTDVEGVYR